MVNFAINILQKVSLKIRFILLPNIKTQPPSPLLHSPREPTASILIQLIIPQHR